MITRTRAEVRRLLIVYIIMVLPPLVISINYLTLGIAKAYMIIKKANHDFKNRD